MNVIPTASCAHSWTQGQERCDRVRNSTVFEILCLGKSLGTVMSVLCNVFAPDWNGEQAHTSEKLMTSTESCSHMSKHLCPESHSEIASFCVIHLPNKCFWLESEEDEV